MNLAELYKRTPVEEHTNIKVLGEKVWIKKGEEVEEYLIEPDGELWPVPSPLKEIRTKMEKLEKGVAELKIILRGGV